MAESGLAPGNLIFTLKQEATELTAIFTAIGKTAKENQKIKNKKNKFEIEHSKSEIK